MADKIVVLRGGHVEQVGAPLELYNRPANRFVAGFIGSPRMNFLDGRILRADARGRDGRGAGRAAARRGGRRRGAAARRAGRARRASRARPGERRTGGAAEARVGATEQLGSDSYLYCELPQGQKLTIHHPGQTRIQRQDAVHVDFDPAACHLFRSGDGDPALPRLA